MSVRLSWGSQNAAIAESVKVYRSATPMDPNALPAPLATLAGSAVTYDDDTIVRNTTAYYRVGIVRGTEEMLSPEFIMGHYPDSGPGPKTLLRGNWNCGYFGTIGSSLMPSISDTTAQLGLTGLSIPGDTNLTLWHKFIRNGKIIFVPNYSHALSVTWIQLYNFGLVFGRDDTGSLPVDITTLAGYTGLVNQNRQVTFAGYNFRVRLPKWSDKPTNVYATGADLVTNEWIDLMGRLGITNTATTPQDKWNDVAAPTTSNGNVGSQNFLSASNNIISPGASYWDNYTTQPCQAGTATGSRSFNWLPFFELVL